MVEIQMGVIESQFADIIWQHEPIKAAELAKYSEKELKWKKTTSYTVLKRLCDKGIFQNDKGVVTSLISRKEFYSLQSRKFVEDTFEGSLPAFIAAFTNGRALTQKDRAQIRKMINNAEED
ncbi:MAG: BlaI/MecI/CopY family transcriptional regulator [Sphaerochaetaceae bacterium]|jgi:predicted transcriptional regulator|nr:BlaI/MecI/CopY family transcriptional regulator [Sphaerochaetaceae bacterium]NLA70854.1 BlaI/MecI/CopY family transcriptional regulator [Clostridiaceae bacterium]